LKLKQKLIKQFMGVGVMKLLSIPIGLVTSIILARVLGPEKFGQYAFIMALIPILALPVSGGVPQLIMREVATYAHSRSWSHYKGLLVAAHGWVVVVSALLLILTWGIGSQTGLLTAQGKWALLPIAALMIPFVGLGAVRSGATKGLGMPVYAEAPQLIVQPIVVLMFIAGTAYFGILEPRIAIFGQLFGAFITFLVASALFIKVQPNLITKLPKSYDSKRWASALLPFSLIALVSTFNAQIGIIILGFMGSDEEVSAMRVAERAGGLIVLSLSIINMVLAPYVARAYQSKDMKKLQNMVTKSARSSFLLSLPLALLLIVMGKEIIELVFGVEYSEISYWPLVVVVAAQLFNVFCGSAGMVLSMSGNEKLTLVGQFVAVLINIVLCISLIPFYGAVGAAFSVGFALITWNLILMYFLKKKLGVTAGPL